MFALMLVRVVGGDTGRTVYYACVDVVFVSLVCFLLAWLLRMLSLSWLRGNGLQRLHSLLRVLNFLCLFSCSCSWRDLLLHDASVMILTKVFKVR